MDQDGFITLTEAGNEIAGKSHERHMILSKLQRRKAQAAAGHTTAAMTLKHYVKGRNSTSNTAIPVASLYGLS